MSDEHVSHEDTVLASESSAQKPQYEAPAIVDLGSPGEGASGQCYGGSGNPFECWDGSAAHEHCDIGSGY